MSVSLAGPDGSVFGGGLAGLFIAAGPVQVVIGSFTTSQEESQQPQHQHQQIKKQRRERLGIPATTQPSNISFGGSEEDPNARYRPNKPVVTQPVPLSAPPVSAPPVSAPPVSAPPVSFSHEPSTNTVHGYYANNTINNIKDLFSSHPGEDDEDDFEGEDDEEFGDESDSDTDDLN